MKKLTGIAIALAGASLTAAAIYVIKSYIESETRLSKTLNNLRDDLELDCDLIEAATEEVPEEIITTADRKFTEAVNNAVDFATTVFNVYAYLSEDEIHNLTAEAKRAYIECLSAIIKNAEKYIYAIDDARDEMVQTRKDMGIAPVANALTP